MNAIAATETAIVVPVPQLEGVVGQHRSRLDRAAAWGVPAHVTVLYPFVPPGQLDDGVLGKVRNAAERLTPIAATFREVGWFDERVVYLSPEPAQWFRLAIEVMVDAFPECPPYGGLFEVVIPHLTIGDSTDYPAMQDAAEAVSGLLPIHAALDRLWVMQGAPAPDSWRVVDELLLTRE